MFTGNIPRKAAFKYINAFSFLFLFFSCTLGVLMGLDELSFVGLCKKKKKKYIACKSQAFKATCTQAAHFGGFLRKQIFVGCHVSTILVDWRGLGSA